MNSMKIFARIVLVVVIIAAGYVALKPHYNTAHWTPNQTMRNLGFSYESVLVYEHYLNWFLHWVTAFIVSLLLYFSELYFPGNPRFRMVTGFLLVVGMAVSMELLQSGMGRDVEIADLVLGICGTFMATALLVFFRSWKGACK
jgi:VanZ family protein